VQRGNERRRCFTDGADFLHYGQELGEAVLRRLCALGAWMLVTNQGPMAKNAPESAF
jgi:hypothetical protein